MSDDHDHVQSPAFFSELAYRDPRRAMEWLSKCFGFQLLNEYKDDAGVVRHAEMRFGKAVLMLSTAIPEKSWRSPSDLTGLSQYVHVYIEEIDEHYRRAEAAGARIVEPLDQTPWGTRRYAAVDPEGHYWSFDTYHPHP